MVDTKIIVVAAIFVVRVNSSAGAVVASGSSIIKLVLFGASLSVLAIVL